MFRNNEYELMTYQLPCGILMNGNPGNQRSFSKRFQLHKKICKLCNPIRMNEFNNYFGNNVQTYEVKNICHIQSAMSSYIEKK
jgi:hypothetical protein